MDARGPFESPQLSPWPSGDITVADLLAVRHLALELIAGDKGLARRVSWTHVCELVDPGPWLDGGELLIANGFRIPTAPSDQIDYLDRLSRQLGRYEGTMLLLKLLAPAATIGWRFIRIWIGVP